MKKLATGLFCMMCLTLTACAALTSYTRQAGLSEELDRSVKSFNKMIRWHETESAGMTYIDPEQREEFLKEAAILKKRGLSVTDFRIITTQYHPEKRSGDVVAEFDYYILPSNRIKTVTYRQEWYFKEDPKGWKLRSGLPAFE